MNRRRSKPAYGEGSIYQRGDGRWVTAVVLESGERKVFYAKTEDEANKNLKEIRGYLDDKLPLPSQQKLGDYLLEWLNRDTRRESVTSATWASYEGHIRLHISPVIGNIRLADLQPEHIDKLVSKLKAKGLAPATIRKIRVTLQTAMGEALKRGHVVRNVVSLTDAPRVPHISRAPLSTDQVKVLFAAVESHRLCALWKVALATGMRRGELIGLRWEDVDFENRLIHVRAQLIRDRISLKVVRRELKTRNANRVVAMGEGVFKLLQEHRDRQDRERDLEARRWQESGYVFTAINGAPLDPDNILRTFQVLTKNAGLPTMTIHDLRHANSSFLAMLNIHPRIAQAQLGHSNFTTTMEIYTHVADEAGRDVAAKVDRLLFEGPAPKATRSPADLDLEPDLRAAIAERAAADGESAKELVHRVLYAYLKSAHECPLP